MCHLAINPENKPKLPIAISVHPALLSNKAPIIRELEVAMKSWNLVRPCFTIVPLAEYNVMPAIEGRTWVNMIHHTGPKLYIGNEPEFYVKWHLKHELGHMLGFGDHIYKSTDSTYYINPKICYGNESDVYRGIMSYCWMNNIITDADREMLIREYPLYAS